MPVDPAATLARLTLEDKARLCTGRDFWSSVAVERVGVPSMVLTDGPHGVRKQPDTDVGDLSASVPATCFPTASALAASWSPALVEEVGAALGDEALAEGVSVLLGPGANIKRTPVCGRNFEYFSEDPLLSSTLAAAWIRGLQRRGVAASLKHVAANNQEHRRFSVDALVDERALREIYLASWEGAVRQARPWTVMCAYNRLNGTYCAEHRWLLTDVLRGEWGFDGVVISDWGAVDRRVPALAAGLDLEMPGVGDASAREVIDAVEDGRLGAAILDRAVERLLTLVGRTARAREGGHAYDAAAHHDLARRAAVEGTVLLKNDGGLLPLAAGADVAVVGAFAKEPRYQGAGSSIITPHRVDDAYAALTGALGAPPPYAPGYGRHRTEVDAALLEEARAVARGRDAVLVFAGLPERAETEGLDREHLRLPPGHDALIEAVAGVNPNVVVVLSNGAPVEMPWHARVPAIVEAYLGGQAGGSAIAAVLLGEAEPGGRLAETFPRTWDEHPARAIPTGPRQVEYRESVYVGYRWFDSARADVRFPFGHGLGYTTFALRDLAVSPGAAADTDDLEVTVSVTVENTGDRAGAEVVQVYVHDAGSTAFRPEQELKAFAKVRLEPGAATRVDLRLGRRAFAYWHPARGAWTVSPGRFEIRVGRSSRDIAARATLTISGAPVEPPPAIPLAGPGRPWDRGAFAALYGRALAPNEPDRPGSFTRNTPLADLRATAAGRAIAADARRRARARAGEDPAGVSGLIFEAMASDANLRMLRMMAGGAASPEAVDALVEAVNGHRLRALRRLAPALGRLAAARLRRRR